MRQTMVTKKNRIVIGAGRTHFRGWKMTQENTLNVLNREDFAKQFAENSLDAILAEHVWEHMTLEEGIRAAQNCFAFLRPGGYMRAAVPDKNFRNANYQRLVQIGGPGPENHPAYTHKIVYDYQTFRGVFEAAGFLVELLEYCDENGKFHYVHWNAEDGYIGRSLYHDTRNSEQKRVMPSSIIDAKKPLILQKCDEKEEACRKMHL